MKSKILGMLIENKNRFVSGEEMSIICGVSRTAIWKHIESLKKEGYEIESVTRKGYRLLPSLDRMEPVFYELPKNTVIGSKHFYLEELDSTNVFAKAAASYQPDGTVIISDCQTAGKGRLGRAWTSTKGKGIWMSLILKPEISMADAMVLTHMAGAAVCEALNEAGFDAKIKWPNDIVIAGKKVCGILSELSGEPEQINFVIVGIGINVNQELMEFEDDLVDKATSLSIVKGTKVDRNRILRLILERLDDYYTLIRTNDHKAIMAFCRLHSATIGKDVKVVYNNKKIEGKAIDLTDEGGLVIEDRAGQTMEIISGEVSVRGLYSYV